MKKDSIQKVFNKESLEYDVYWLLIFTWVYPNKPEKDFKSIIKAPSGEKAVDLLKGKVERKGEGNSIRSQKFYKIHSRYRLSHKKNSTLSIEQWQAIREGAFPNALDRLYLIEKVRKEGQENYFNRNFTQKDKERLLKQGFKSGKDSWHYKNPISKENRPPEDQMYLFRPAKGYRRGEVWERIPEEERREERAVIAQALTKANGNRREACRLLEIEPKTLYRMLNNHPEIDWNTLYPIGGRPKRSKESIEKQKITFKNTYSKEKHPFYGKKRPPSHGESIFKAHQANREKRLKKLKPKIISLLKKHDNIRILVAKDLNVSTDTLYKYFKEIKEIDWGTEYPSPKSFKNNK
jgi:DNA-binding NtrC family response regulator